MNKKDIHYCHLLVGKTGEKFGRGFSLIELMIVVAIIGILSSIALPAYNEYVLRSVRAQAQACVSQIAQALERRYTTALSYAGDIPVLGCATEGGLDSRYTIAANIAARTYAISAAPQGGQSHDKCGTLGLDQTGAKTASEGTNCW